MKKWDYKTFKISNSKGLMLAKEIEKLCNDYGMHGWELVSIEKEDDYKFAIFKRERKQLSSCLWGSFEKTLWI